MSNVVRISKLSKHDESIANIIYAKDCICCGDLSSAVSAINFAIHNLGKDNAYQVDDEVVRLLSKAKI
jgi:hypothetical protein